MGREDALRMPTRWGRGSLAGRMALSGSRFPMGRPLEVASRRFVTPVRSLSQGAPAIPQVPITSQEANRLQALLGRVVEEMKKRGKDPSGVMQVKEKLDHLASGSAPESIMTLSQQDIQAMDTSLQEMKKGADWTSIAVLGTALMLLGSAAYWLAE